MHISKTEEMTIAEQAEAENALMGITQQPEEGQQEGGAVEGEGSEGEAAQPAEGEGTEGEGNQGANTEGTEENTPQGATYVVDPVTGELIDSISGLPAEISRSYEGEESGESGENEE